MKRSGSLLHHRFSGNDSILLSCLSRQQIPYCRVFGQALIWLAVCMMLSATKTYATETPVVTGAQSNSLLAVHPSGNLIACANRDSGSVSIVEWPAMKKRAEVKVGLHPECVAWIPGTSLVACSVYGEDRIDVIDADSLKIVHRIDVFDEPYGIVGSSDGKYLYATLEYPGEVVRISTSSWKVDAVWKAGAMPRGIAVSRDNQSLYVTEYLTARLQQISTVDGQIVKSFEPAATDNLCRQITLSPDGSKAYITHIRSRITAAHGNGSIFPYVTVVPLIGEKAGERTRVPMDSLQGARVTANPTEVDISPDGSLLFVIFGGTNDMFICRILDDYKELDYRTSVRLGSNPRAVRVTPDGSTALVYNSLDFELVAVRTEDGKVTGRCQVTDNPLSDEILLGKKLFYTALQPMSSRNWISCSSCHPDGDSDGRTWQNPEGLRATQPLAGLSWTHPVHWSADRDEVQDFEHTVRGKLMQGQGLLQNQLPDALGSPISGQSRMLDALAAYTNSHKFTISPHAKNGLSEAAKRGQQLFLSDRTKCATCHTGPWYTDSQPREATEIVRHDVGTGRDDPSELMSPAYDTPTLLGIYRSAPYLHHGKAATLRDVLTTANQSDQHGVTSGLSETEIDDLVEFLKALPFEDPEPAAFAAGLKQVLK